MKKPDTISKKDTLNNTIIRKSEIYFDGVALENEIIGEPEQCYQFVMEKIRHMAGKESASGAAMRLLDVGCGTGNMLVMLQQEIPDMFSVSGVDISEESLRVAENRCKMADSVFVRSESADLPFGDEEFDVILCMHSFHHYPDPDLSLQEMYRVLKPDGVLYLVENDFKTLRRIRTNIGLWIRRYPRGDIYMYSQKKLGLLVKRAGFILREQSHIADHSQFLECGKGKDRQTRSSSSDNSKNN